MSWIAGSRPARHHLLFGEGLFGVLDLEMDIM
jgi:hypothetical protein